MFSRLDEAPEPSHSFHVHSIEDVSALKLTSRPIPSLEVDTNIFETKGRAIISALGNKNVFALTIVEPVAKERIVGVFKQFSPKYITLQHLSLLQMESAFYLPASLFTVSHERLESLTLERAVVPSDLLSRLSLHKATFIDCEIFELILSSQLQCLHVKRQLPFPILFSAQYLKKLVISDMSAKYATEWIEQRVLETVELENIVDPVPLPVPVRNVSMLQCSGWANKPPADAYLKQLMIDDPAHIVAQETLTHLYLVVPSYLEQITIGLEMNGVRLLNLEQLHIISDANRERPTVMIQNIPKLIEVSAENVIIARIDGNNVERITLKASHLGTHGNRATITRDPTSTVA